MLRLRVLQAKFGDCLILEYGTESEPRYILIDGGPKNIYDKYLRPELERIRDNHGKIDLLLLSHVDSDHVGGLLNLFADLRQQSEDGEEKTVQIDSMWHNSFVEMDGGSDIYHDLNALFSANRSLATSMSETNFALLSIKEGSKLTLNARDLNIPINPEFGGRSIIADESAGPVRLNGLEITVIGPTRKNLERLKKKWKAWMKKYGSSLSDPKIAASADNSIPNLSSIMVLARSGGKSILLTGDGRGDHIVEGLAHAGLLRDRVFRVDVLKVPHHGSEKNTTAKFFDTITAPEYVISADGTDENPDLPTLKRIVDAAKKRNERITIHVTNSTESVKKLVQVRPPNKYNYCLNIMEDPKRPIVIRLA